MTLARQRVLSSSMVGASGIEHERSWVRMPSAAQIFVCPLMVDSLYLPLFPVLLSHLNSEMIGLCTVT